jgi:uncharacterized protein
VIRAVIDTSVLVSAFIGNQEASPGRVVDAWQDGRLSMIVSPQLLNELKDVLERPKFTRWSSAGRGAAYVAGFGARSEHHSDPAAQGSHLRDPKDEYLVALALAAGADALVSLDRDILDASVEGLLIVSPTAFLDHLGTIVE